MTKTKAVSRRDRAGSIKAFAIAVGAAVLLWAAPARTEETLAFVELTDPAEFDLAKALLWRDIYIFAYDPARRSPSRPPKYPSWRRQSEPPVPPDTYEKYLRTFVSVARADLNGDGVDEVFYRIDDAGYCGETSCLALVFEKQKHGWIKICRTPGGEVIKIVDWQTEGGGAYREIESEYRTFWVNDRCHFDDPRMRKPYAPPPERVRVQPR